MISIAPILLMLTVLNHLNNRDALARVATLLRSKVIAIQRGSLARWLMTITYLRTILPSTVMKKLILLGQLIKLLPLFLLFIVRHVVMMSTV